MSQIGTKLPFLGVNLSRRELMDSNRIQTVKDVNLSTNLVTSTQQWMLRPCCEKCDAIFVFLMIERHSWFRGVDAFFLKISNVDREDRNFPSLSDYNLTSPSAFVPRATHAFVTYSNFPVDFEPFKRFVVAELKLPRLANPLVFMYCSFWEAFRQLDHSRYHAVKSCFAKNGPPALEAHRKIYVVCDWSQIHK